MKLLPPQQRKALKDQEVLRDILRSQEMDKISDNARKNLAKAEADFDASMLSQQRTWEEASANHMAQVAKETAELEALEHKRAIAMQPIQKVRDEATKLLAEVKEFKAKTDIQATANEDTAEILQDKLDDVGAREQDVAREKAKLDNRQKGIEDQAFQVGVSVKELGRLMRKFEDYKTGELKNLDERKTALSLWDISLQAKEEKQKRTDKALFDKEKRLADERQSLEAGFAELKESKKLSP